MTFELIVAKSDIFSQESSAIILVLPLMILGSLKPLYHKTVRKGWAMLLNKTTQLIPQSPHLLEET